MVGWGLADFFAKLSVDRIGSLASLVWAHLIGAAVIIGVVLARDVATANTPDWPHAPGTWLEIVGFGIGQAAVYLLVYRAFERGRLAVLNPIFSAYGGVAAVLAIVFFGDHVSPAGAVALAFVFAGVMVLSIDRSGAADVSAGAGVKEIVAAAVLAATWTVLWDQLVSGRDWWTYVALMYVVMAAVMLVVLGVSRVAIERPRGVTLRLVAGIGAAEVLAYLSISVGFSTTRYTSVVAVLSGAFSIPAIMLARYFLGDRLSRTHLVGAAAVIAGSIVLATVGAS